MTFLPQCGELARLGRDTEVRYTTSVAVVATLALAFNYGRRGDDGKRPTQWIDASLKASAQRRWRPT